MPPERPAIRFCRSNDGARIAYTTSGEGPLMVKAANWVSHLDHDWNNAAWGPWLRGLSRRHTLLRYDPRGCGLSDHVGIAFSFEKYVEDLAAVVDAAGGGPFALFGFAGGGAIAVAYAARHPMRVSHLVLYGSFVRGRFARTTTPRQREEEETLIRLIELGWGKDDPSFRSLFVSQFLPDASSSQVRAFNEMMRLSATPQNAASLMRAWFVSDVSELAPQVRCPTLVLHPRGCLRVPFEEGRDLARLIPGARFVPLESRNLVLLEDEPAFERMLDEVDRFLPASTTAAVAGLRLDQLTAREVTILDAIARGLGNGEIGRELNIREKTVRNQVSAILGKLGLVSRSQAIVRAREAGLGRSPASR